MCKEHTKIVWLGIKQSPGNECSGFNVQFTFMIRIICTEGTCASCYRTSNHVANMLLRVHGKSFTPYLCPFCS